MTKIDSDANVVQLKDGPFNSTEKERFLLANGHFLAKEPSSTTAALFPPWHLTHSRRLCVTKSLKPSASRFSAPRLMSLV